jgi:hypothetical protein
MLVGMGIPEGINALTSSLSNTRWNSSNIPEWKNHDLQQKCPTTELPTAVVIRGAQ